MIDFVAHEMGHQWGGNHSFNGDGWQLCGRQSQRRPTAYEPGSGSTIQAYAGICGVQNLQGNSDPYFHGISLDEIIAYSTSRQRQHLRRASLRPATTRRLWTPAPRTRCRSKRRSSSVVARSDPDSDPVTYGWEEFDLGPAGAPGSPVGDAPIFRSFNPDCTSPCRTFPRMSDLAAGSPGDRPELLPTYAQDNELPPDGAGQSQSGGGGVDDDATTVTVSDAAGPFPGDGSQHRRSAWPRARPDDGDLGCGFHRSGADQLRHGGHSALGRWRAHLPNLVGVRCRQLRIPIRQPYRT